MVKYNSAWLRVFKCGQSVTALVLLRASLLSFAPVYVIPPVPHTVFIYILLLPEGQMGEAWEPSKKQCSFGNRGVLDRKILSIFFRSLNVKHACNGK
jgi:hypothetical protein